MIDYLDDWTAALEWFRSPDYDLLLEQLDRDGELVEPAPEVMLNAYRWFPPEATKVVILGDHPEVGTSTGLAFAVPPEQRSPTIDNIFLELELDCGEVPDDGTLTGWSRQGVLLLNTTLSRLSGDPTAHSKLWAGLIRETISLVATVSPTAVFVFWGSAALNYRSILRRSHHYINSAHPHPDTAGSGFFGSRPFSIINTALISSGQRPINWAA